MKNKIKYILLPAMLIIALIFIATNYGQRLRFGDAWFENDTANKILTNKSLYFESGDSVYYNGVVVTSGTGGGGIAASDNTTFTGINTFTDSLRANGYSIIDDAKITSYLRVTGEVTTDLIFNKGSSTSIGTISTDSLAFITNNTKRIVIDKYGYTVFTDTVQMLDRVYITGNLNVASNIYTVGNITADSIAGIGAFITDVNAVTLKGQDTTKFARTDTLITERVKSKVEFSDVVTFFLSPVFSALVDFANGITTTTITASSTATFNGDMVNTGWQNQGAMTTRFKYYKDTVLFLYLGPTSPPYIATTYSVAHGISNWKSITQSIFIVHDDSLNYNMMPNTNALNGAAGYIYSIAGTDSLNAFVRVPAAGVHLFNDTCTISIRYTDYNR